MSNGLRRVCDGRIAPGTRQERCPFENHANNTLNHRRSLQQPSDYLFIERELETFQEIGFTEVSLGPRILRVETVIACLIGRLF